MAVSADVALVGARYDSFTGTAYVFLRSGASWTKQQVFPDDLVTSDYFGWSVALSGSTAVVGSTNDEENGVSSGSAYVFDLLLE